MWEKENSKTFWWHGRIAAVAAAVHGRKENLDNNMLNSDFLIFYSLQSPFSLESRIEGLAGVLEADLPNYKSKILKLLCTVYVCKRFMDFGDNTVLTVKMFKYLLLKKVTFPKHFIVYIVCLHILSCLKHFWNLDAIWIIRKESREEQQCQNDSLVLIIRAQ